MTELTKEEEAMLGTEGVCENCGEQGYWCINPYCEEIYGEQNLVCLCDDCYQIYCDDI